MKKVEALIIGAGRSGTTTLFKYLENHSEICFSNIKEIHYFSVEELNKRGDDYYHSFFDKNAENKLKVSADTYLFIDKTAPERIKKYNENMRFLIMIRNPIERAFSGYNYAINNGYLDEKTSFIDSIKNEKELLKKDLTIEEMNNLCNAYQSLYTEHINFWLNFFPKENFLILETNELKNDLKKFLEKVSSFLSVSSFDTKNKTEVKANKSSKVKSKTIEQFLLNRNTGIRKLIRKIVPKKIKNKIINSGVVDKLHNANKTVTEEKKISEKEYEWAKNYFSEEIKKLSEQFEIKF